MNPSTHPCPLCVHLRPTFRSHQFQGSGHAARLPAESESSDGLMVMMSGTQHEEEGAAETWNELIVEAVPGAVGTAITGTAHR